MSYDRREIMAQYISKVQKVKAGSMGRVGMINREIAMMRSPNPMIENVIKSNLIRISANVVKRVRKEVM